MGKQFYNAYTEEDKKKYKELDSYLEDKFTRLFEVNKKESRKQAILFIIYGVIIFLLTFTDILSRFFSIFYFMMFYTLAVINFFIAYISFDKRICSKLYYISLILMIINIILDFSFMFSLF